MTQTLKLADNLLAHLKSGDGNTNTIREGKRDINPGILWFEGTVSSEKLPVYVTEVTHKKLSEITDAEAQANGEPSREDAIQNMKVLYAHLGRSMTDDSPITIIDFKPFRSINPEDFMHYATEHRWRGGEALARWAKAGEEYTKPDGTSNTTSGGEVAILKPNSVTDENPLGEIAWALPRPIASSSYDISALPNDPLDLKAVTIQSKPTRVWVKEVIEPVCFSSPFEEGEGAKRYLVPGDLLEKSERGPVVAVAKDMIETRYISQEQAEAVLAKGSRAA